MRTDETGDDALESGVSIAIVHVFDVSQTDPIPGHPHSWEPPARHAARGDEAVAWADWEAILVHAATIDLTVSTSESDPFASPDTYGYYHRAARAVWVRSGRDRADTVATLAHELAHGVTHIAAAGTRPWLVRFNFEAPMARAQ